MARVLPLLAWCSLAPLGLAQELADDPEPLPPVWEELLRLRARLEALEGRGLPPSATEPVAIDLEDTTVTLPESGATQVLARPWFENVRLGGYAAVDYLDTGGTGTTPDGSFVLKEASLFLDAQVWEDTFLFTELWLARYQFGSGIALGELNLQLVDLVGGVSAKVGRFELPFGEEYLRWDATETPLVSFTAADPYGIDRGIELYGNVRGVRWIAAVANGAASASDDGPGKLVCAKLSGAPLTDLYLSGSVLATGGTERTALRLSGSQLTPVGLDGPASAGASPSTDVESRCWELDARIAEARTVRLALAVGGAQIDDDVDAFDRDLTWFLVEPAVRLRDDLELVLRWSEIGTYDDDEGYRFAGKIVADGETFGYDTSVLRRLSAGLRWTVHPRLAVKLEVGQDDVELVDASAQDAENDERFFFAVEVVGAF